MSIKSNYKEMVSLFPIFSFAYTSNIEASVLLLFKVVCNQLKVPHDKFKYNFYIEHLYFV